MKWLVLLLVLAFAGCDMAWHRRTFDSRPQSSLTRKSEAEYRYYLVHYSDGTSEFVAKEVEP